MADRRPDDPSVARPAPSAPPASSPTPPRPEVDLTERINQAYASSAPIVPDERSPEDTAPGRGSGDTGSGRPGGAERFAAVLAATTNRMKESTSTRGGSTPAGAAAGTPAGTAAGRPAGAPAGRPAGTAAAAPPASARRPTGTASARTAPRTRKARLRVTHVDPWSVMKTAFLLSIALGIVTVVAVGIVWSVLGAADVWGSIDKAVNDVLGDTTNPFRIENYLGMSRVMGFTLIVAVADVILVTVLATLGAFLYNLAAALLGGIEMVLAEDDR